ncbi:ferredoxin [candidate division WOR-1 bacterium RIFOXYB2_FULL_42_35]|uniref:Ferredoxin n=1 Tax=candidate division WOR-1 bacterium RIFOXYC2_FULL_41_25 TaxID=1802586 RepID=A0A1F4TPQ6_UNCSA|nr:MAG: ferredoxin [candidate division WOR-1 bacterium RIFOXYB2_FULL_42_35]OGC24562.1 MAG: ferredoxin [candidate division WOR-1 bacterium RIFOXYA2_FULL_41_14]OGC34607.1 MAG: ferredoxin [candidate division WOR-1 bacterium RIFOXYC2_FULL_41_25]OGC43986.1 MAG: ferredoxin [candidate division WOR-1 bacterium RIFOXYD2_FULL_41_8]
MLKNEKDFKEEQVIVIAQQMCLAARTAPKGKGLDLLEMVVISGGDIKKVSQKMEQIGQRENNATFLRDSQNILQAQAIVLIGTKLKTMGLRYCGLCGFPNCAENEKNKGICVFNPGDLGIAVGSAVSVATDHRLDNRVMYTIGLAALELKLLVSEVKIAFGIPLSVSGKNPFFDRRV